MVEAVILNKTLLLSMKKRRKMWKSSFTFLVVFRARVAPHSWESTMYLWELDLSREMHTCA